MSLANSNTSASTSAGTQGGTPAGPGARSTNGSASMSTTMATNKASMVEPRTGVEGVNTEEMFLSPRVMDAGAFARYSEMLRAIIAQASAQGRTLEDFSVDAEAMLKRCHDAGDTINKRLQAGIRMLKMIDERAERTDLLLSKVQGALPDSQQMVGQIDALIEERMGACRQRLDAIVDGAQERVLEAERRAQEATALSQEYATRLAALASAVEDRLGALEAGLDESRTVADDSVRALRRQASEAQSLIEDSIGSVLARARETGDGLTEKIEEAVSMTDARIAELGRSLEPVIEASSRAMRSLGMDPEHPVFEDSPLSRIEKLVERGQAQLESLDASAQRLEELQSRAEGVRGAFEGWLARASRELDTLEARKEQIVGPMSEAAARIKELGPDLSDQLELASTQLTHLQIEQQTLRQTIQASSSLAGEVTDRMSNHAGQLQALLDGSLHKLSARVEQAGVWLGTLIQRAESLGTALGSVAQETRAESVDEAGQLRIEPTRAADQAMSQAEPVSQKPGSQQPAAQAPISPEPAPQDGFEPGGIPMASFSIPRPAQLPIDALSFDGAARVIEHLREQA